MNSKRLGVKQVYLIMMVGAVVLARSQALADANTLRLDEARAEAIARSPDLKITDAQGDEARGVQTQALSGFLPKVSAFGYHYTNIKDQTFTTAIGGTQEFTIPVIIPETSMKLSLDLPLFNLNNIQQFRSSSVSSSAAAVRTQWETFLLTQRVDDAFYKALAAEELAQVADENIKTLEDHFNQVQARKKGGIATNYDVLRVEVQLDEARTQKIQDDDDVVIARMHLARVMGLPNDKRQLAGELPAPETISEIEGLSPEGAVKDRKDLQAINLQEKAADIADSGAKSWWVPTFGAMADYEFYNNLNSDLLNNDPYRNDYDVGVYMRWNLFDGGASVGRSQQTEARLHQAEATAEREVQKLPEDLENWRRRYHYGTSLYRTSVADIKKSEESVRQAKEGFREGVRTVSEQLDAQLDLFRSRAAKINAQLTAAEALLQLEMTIGRKLSHDNHNN